SGTATGSAGRSTTGSKSRQLSASESDFAEEPVQTTCQIEEPSHLMFETGAEDQPSVQTSQHPKWFSQPRRPPSPDRDWNKALPTAQGDAQSWISVLARQTDARSSFNELLDTPIDFSNFIMNRLNVDTLTPALLAGPTYELIMGSCNSLTELEYHLEELYKATTDQLDWVNPEGQQYPHNLLQPLPLIPDNRGRRVIPFEHFINNDLEYLRGGGCFKPYALWGVSHWGRKRQQFYGFAVNREFTLDVYSKRRIIAVTELKIVEWHNYKHLDWISLSNLTVEEHFAFNVSLRMFTRSIVIQRRVKDLQLGVESYQKRLNLTKPDTYRPDLKRREVYTAYSNPRGFIYQNKDKKNRLMRIDELHKFSDRMLNDFCNTLDDRLKGIWMQYLLTTIWRRGDKDRAAAMIQAIDKMLKTRRIMRSLEKFPLPLIPDNRGRRVIPFEHFINNDLDYLRGGASSRKYTTSVTKTKAADYGHIKWIKDLVPREMWIQQPIDYNKHALWGVSHWGRKRKQFYGYAINRESARDVYSKRRIITVTELQIMKWHDYKDLDWILVRRDDDQIYKFKEGDFKRLRLQDIEDMLLLLPAIYSLAVNLLASEEHPELLILTLNHCFVPKNQSQPLDRVPCQIVQS
nr:hypothetical protein [Tanacetum cinerariifolium]